MIKALERASLTWNGSGNEPDDAVPRTNRIANLQTRMVNAADVAIDSLAN